MRRVLSFLGFTGRTRRSVSGKQIVLHGLGAELVRCIGPSALAYSSRCPAVPACPACSPCPSVHLPDACAAPAPAPASATPLPSGGSGLFALFSFVAGLFLATFAPCLWQQLGYVVGRVVGGVGVLHVSHRRTGAMASAPPPRFSVTKLIVTPDEDMYLECFFVPHENVAAVRFSSRRWSPPAAIRRARVYRFPEEPSVLKRAQYLASAHELAAGLLRAERLWPPPPTLALEKLGAAPSGPPDLAPPSFEGGMNPAGLGGVTGGLAGIAPFPTIGGTFPAPSGQVGGGAVGAPGAAAAGQREPLDLSATAPRGLQLGMVGTACLCSRAGYGLKFQPPSPS